jgi:hypothetical protein
MSKFMEGDIKELKQTVERERRMLNEMMVGRELRVCKCGTLYSFGAEVNWKDPGSCPECGDRLGEIIR